ncbi:MAG: T9SS type A sorting domain-containing protein, partial [Bacteroides sp.]|nr:T9SS type A sorting domain-containing protein [Bacteroides sp.]
TPQRMHTAPVYETGLDLAGSVWFGPGAGACRLKDGLFSDFITTMPEQSVSPFEIFAFYREAQASIHLEYMLDQPLAVSARLYDIRGMLVQSWKNLSSTRGLNQEDLSLSIHSSGFSSSGIYILQLIHGSQSDTKKIVITNPR